MQKEKKEKADVDEKKSHTKTKYRALFFGLHRCHRHCCLTTNGIPTTARRNDKQNTGCTSVMTPDHLYFCIAALSIYLCRNVVVSVFGLLEIESAIILIEHFIEIQHKCNAINVKNAFMHSVFILM